MGSLASHPKPVAQPQYVPVYYTAPTPPPASPDPVPTGQTPDPDPTPARRNANLLERSRGVLSTVLTGFRGVLSQTTTQPRKTLLGE
jgi:hypothetical protein